MFQLSSQNQWDRAESNAYVHLQTKTQIFQFNTTGLKEHLLYSILAYDQQCSSLYKKKMRLEIRDPTGKISLST